MFVYMKYILMFVILSCNCFSQDQGWKYEDGWVFEAKKEDASAGGAIIQRKVVAKNEYKYTNNNQRYVTTDEWKRILGSKPIPSPQTNIQWSITTCGVIGKCPEPTSTGLLQIGLAFVLYFSRKENRIICQK